MEISKTGCGVTNYSHVFEKKNPHLSFLDPNQVHFKLLLVCPVLKNRNNKEQQLGQSEKKKGTI